MFLTLLSNGGLWCRILGNQQLFLAGLSLTSPLFAAVTQNMIPVITFLLASLLGYSCTLYPPLHTLTHKNLFLYAKVAWERAVKYIKISAYLAKVLFERFDKIWGATNVFRRLGIYVGS